MMGPAQKRDSKLFYVGIDLDGRMPPDHPLRRIAQLVDFHFVRDQVADTYGHKGNPSVDPAVLLKLMFLLFYENVPSERQLMAQLPVRLDWMWFCGYDFDDAIPDHSVISKARRRWGPEVFQTMFEQVLDGCVATGLVDGSVVHVDASVVEADADPKRMRPALRWTARKLYDRLESSATPERKEETPPLLESSTDPEARMTAKDGIAVLGYKEHRVVDDRAQVITAVATTPAATPEAEVLEALLDRHADNTGKEAETPVADKGYGTAENYHMLHERGMTPCIPHLEAADHKGQFGLKEFTYDRQRDCFICAAGEVLKREGWDESEQRFRYKASAKTCRVCVLRARCTKSSRGRRVGRLLYQDDVDWADRCLSRSRRRHLMKRRKICAEGSFADAANNHGLKRARWRGLMRVGIQGMLIATVQNVRKLLKASRRGLAAAQAACRWVLRFRSSRDCHGFTVPLCCRPSFWPGKPKSAYRQNSQHLRDSLFSLGATCY
jgi:transposase